MKVNDKPQFVLDASVTVAWCFSDEATSASIGLLESLDKFEVIVPSLWQLEINNILVNAIKKKRLSYADAVLFLQLLQKLNIRIESDCSAKIFQDIFHLAYSEDLTTYDAAYLELAMRKGVPLASRDKALCQVAKKLGVVLLPA